MEHTSSGFLFPSRVSKVPCCFYNAFKLIEILETLMGSLLPKSQVSEVPESFVLENFLPSDCSGNFNSALKLNEFFPGNLYFL